MTAPPTYDLADLTFDGDRADLQVRSALTGRSEVVTTCDGASTLTLQVHDPDRTVLRSGILDRDVTIGTQGRDWTVVKVGKQGDLSSVTAEPAAVVQLRDTTGPLSAAAGTTTRSEFAARLARDAAVPVGLLQPSPQVRVQVARGSESDPDETTWDALGRIAGDVNWRRWVHDGRLHFASDPWLIERADRIPVREHTGGVHQLDADVDRGKVTGTASIGVDIDRWTVAPASVADVGGLGPLNGLWLVTEIRRPLFSPRGQIKLARPINPDPEPEG